MPPRGQELGKRRPFVRRPGIGKFPPWDGMNREGDPASVPANAFRMLINTRTEDSEIRSRGGQRSLNGDEPIDGCVSGVWPPDYEPPDQTFTRLIIGFPVPYCYAPAEDDEPFMMNNLNLNPDWWYWSGDRLLTVTDEGVNIAVLEEFKLVKNAEGKTQFNDDFAQRLVFTYSDGDPGPDNAVGAPVLGNNGKYYCPVMDSDVLSLMEITYGASSWEDTPVDAGDSSTLTDPKRFATKTPDGRIVWYNDDDDGTNAILSIRSAAGTFTDLDFPAGFTPIQDSLSAWCWFNAKLYIAGDDGSGLNICEYDPVTNLLALKNPVSLSIADRCAMAVHRGVLYFSYETTGGAHRIGTYRAGVWTDSVFSSANPDPIVHMCSFQSHLYVTKGPRVFRASNLAVTGTLTEWLVDTTSYPGEPFRYMVAVP
jgi:hypothetical protein